ncbi:hypothetical protein [Aeromonas jandaei]|uniref:hypothetical protein n=1 Tax=Aeromonas jandaei TaxID=650 RepID=UPI003B9EC31A
MNPSHEQIKQAEQAVITTLSALRTLAELTGSDRRGDDTDKDELLIGVSALLDITAQYLANNGLEHLDTLPNLRQTPVLSVVEGGEQ